MRHLKLTATADLHAADVDFAHLHNHSQFSILQATTVVSELVRAAVDNGHAGVALTDLGQYHGRVSL